MTTAISTIFLLIIYIGHQHNFGNDSSLPVDYEQDGLADQIVIKVSHVVSENTPKGLAFSKFAELIEEKTDGKIRVEIYPNSILYSDEDEISALLNNDIQMIAPSFSKMTERIPEWQVLDLPYLLRDYEDVKNALTGNTSRKLLHLLEEKEQMKGMAFWSNGFKQMTTNRHPIKDVRDFTGLQVRTMSSDMLQKQFTLVNAGPVETSFDKVYSILEQKEIDAQENTLSNIYSKGFYKVQKYMTISNHGFLGYAVIMNVDFWNSLSTDLQKKVQAAIDETTLWNLQQSEIMNNADLQKIKTQGNMEIYTLTEEQQQEWINTFRPLYKFYSSEINSHLIEEIQLEIQSK